MEIKDYYIQISLVLITAVVGLFFTKIIPEYIDKNEVSVQVSKLTANGRKIYILNFKNNSGDIHEFGFRVKAGVVYSSSFAGNVILRNVPAISGKKPGDEADNIEIKEGKKYYFEFTGDYKLSDDVFLTDEEIEVNDDVDDKWYEINQHPFLFKSDSEVSSFLITDEELDMSYFECTPKQVICEFLEFEYPNKEVVMNVSSALGVSSGVYGNKIFVSGDASAIERTKAASIITAKERAYAELYRNIVRSLYGVKVQSMEKIYHEKFSSSKGGHSYDEVISHVIRLDTKGIVDINSIYVISDKGRWDSELGYVYSIEAFYELPASISFDDENEEVEIGRVLGVPVVKRKVQPDWVNGDFSELPEGFSYFVGMIENKYPEILARRLAENSGLIAISKSMNVKVSAMEKSTYPLSEDLIEDEDSNLLVSKIVHSSSLSGVAVFEYYESNDFYYALMRIKQDE